MSRPESNVPAEKQATICLNMIVKNESEVIRRCLDSVRPFIDTWVIVDTGSTDGTQSIIREHLKDIPGDLFERPWVNFGHNRSEAITLAGTRSDFLFMIDADEVLDLPKDFSLPALTADIYSLNVDYQGTDYGRFCLMSTRKAWRYVGVLHEYPTADGDFTRGTLRGPQIRCFNMQGGRSKNMSAVEKYANDARILEKALRKEPENGRYVFYLAQSYRDAGELQKSLKTYERRSRMGGWDEEVWYSLYQVAKLSERLKLAPEIVTNRYMQAYQYRFRRAEPLVDLARLYREQKHYVLAHLFAERAIKTKRPDDILFLDAGTYEWRAIDEYAVASYWVGNYQDCAHACQALLKSGAAPEEHVVRITKNLHFATDAMAANKPPAPASILSATP